MFSKTPEANKGIFGIEEEKVVEDNVLCQLSRFKGGLRWRGKFILASKPDFSKILIPAFTFIIDLL